ncbi:hypothetical protein, partial [Streptomyces ipomoeae]
SPYATTATTVSDRDGLDRPRTSGADEMTHYPSRPAGSPPSDAEFARMAARLDRMDRRIEGGCTTAAGLFAVGGTGALASAVHQYAVVHDGSMASAGVALATALFVAAARLVRRVRASRRARERRAGG